PEGTIALSATQTDAVGNTSALSVVVSIEIDQTPPVPGVISFEGASPDESVRFDDTGDLGDEITSDTDFHLELIPPNPDATYERSTDGGVTWLPTTLAQTNLEDGVYHFRARVTDVAGNQAFTESIRVEIDNTNPEAPVIDIQPETKIQLPPITGTGESGATVTVVAEVDLDGNGSIATEIGQAVVESDGTWEITSTETLPEGPIALTATQTDPAGNESSNGDQTVTIDLTAPPVGAAEPGGLTIEIDLTANEDQVSTNDTTPIIKGTGEVGATVTLFADADDEENTAEVQIGTTTVESDGTWRIESSVALDDGLIALAATQTDEADNVSGRATGSVDIDIDTADPDAALTINVLPVTGDSTPEITGTGTPGEKVV
ncbi:unnamed protein product, partial [marine sediment metagenome]